MDQHYIIKYKHNKTGFISLSETVVGLHDKHSNFYSNVASMKQIKDDEIRDVSSELSVSRAINTPLESKLKERFEIEHKSDARVEELQSKNDITQNQYRKMEK